MSTLTENTSYVLGTDSDEIGASAPAGNIGFQKDGSQTGFFIHSKQPYTLWLKTAGVWSQHQAFSSSDLQESTTYAWGSSTAAYVQTAESTHQVFVYPRTGSLLIDGDTSDSSTDADTLVQGPVTTPLNVTSPSGGSTDMGGTMTSHIIPDTNAAYDLGNAEYKIRHLFLSDNSLWVGDGHKISVDDSGVVGFRKRKNTIMPSYLTSEGVDESEVLAHFGVASIDDITPHQWLEFSHIRLGNPNLGIEDIFLGADFEAQQGTTLNAPTVNGALEITSTDIDETAFRVSVPGQDNMFCVDAKSSYDDKARITVKTTNDFDASDVPYLGFQRGLFHIEREADDIQPAISVWTHGGAATDVSGINLLSWSTQENQGSYINLLSNDGAFPSGYVPETKVLGRVAFGGYTNNQHRQSAFVEAKATENWNYGNKLGSKLVFRTCGKGGNTIGEHLTVSSAGVFVHSPDAAPDTADMNNSTTAMHLDEAQNKLTFTVKYSDGTVKTGTVDLS